MYNFSNQFKIRNVKNTYYNSIWKILMSIIKFHSHFGNFMRKYFLADWPLWISPQALGNFTQTKTKKKCTSNKSKSIWAGHGNSKHVSNPVEEDGESRNKWAIFSQSQEKKVPMIHIVVHNFTRIRLHTTSNMTSQ